MRRRFRRRCNQSSFSEEPYEAMMNGPYDLTAAEQTHG